METDKNKDLGDKTWNNEQKKGEINEGFSGENLPDDYNPAEHLKEVETDSSGNKRIVKRARDANQTSSDEQDWDSKPGIDPKLDRKKIEGKEDFNYDQPKRQ